MKTKPAWSAAIITVLFVALSHSAEPKSVKSSDVPPELQKSISTLSKGSETKYFRYDSDTSTVMWRVEIQGQNEKKSWLIETRESVSNGRTNVSVIKADAMRPKK
jgi:hypothetical protein